MTPKKNNARSAARLDGCLTTSDGLMPKLTLFRSDKIYRLEARSMLLTENPLLFANNTDALVHVTGHLGPLHDIYDPDRSPVFIVDTIEKLATTCDVKMSLAELRKESENGKAAPGSTSSASANRTKPDSSSRETSATDSCISASPTSHSDRLQTIPISQRE